MQIPEATLPEDDCFLAFITVLVDEVLGRYGALPLDPADKTDKSAALSRLPGLHKAA